MKEHTGLDLSQTKVSAEAVQALAGALPRCTIESDHGVFEPRGK